MLPLLRPKKKKFFFPPPPSSTSSPGVESVYLWEGKLERSQELLLMVKTRAELADDVAAFVKANHPYDLPETILLPITGGSAKYIQWVLDNTKHH